MNRNYKTLSFIKRRSSKVGIQVACLLNPTVYFVYLTQVGLDPCVPEGEVGEGHHGVPSHLPADGVGCWMQTMLNLVILYDMYFVQLGSGSGSGSMNF